MGRTADIAGHGILAACRGGWEGVTKMVGCEQNESRSRVFAGPRIAIRPGEPHMPLGLLRADVRADH